MPERSFPCSNCGADLAFAPGKNSLECEHCGALNALPETGVAKRAEALTEHSYHRSLSDLADSTETIDRVEVACRGCGAHTQLSDNVTSGHCAFCGTPIVAQGKSTKLVRPKALLAFAVDTFRATGAYQTWMGALWFAPSDLKRLAFLDGSLRGVYLPYWTYDCETTTDYTGRRGEDYWDTETYTTVVNGRMQTRTRTVRKTRWYPAAGRVHLSFNDVLVPGTQSLPTARLDTLEPWDLGKLEPYDDAFLAGFTTESYTVTLQAGFGSATLRMQARIDLAIRADIGGDHQVITSKDTDYDQITFKHILLPVWVCAYRYRGKLYQILINARTGELTGDRPYSITKIIFAVLAGLLVLGAVAGVIALSNR